VPSLSELPEWLGYEVLSGVHRAPTTRTRLPDGKWIERVSTDPEVALYDAVRALVAAAPGRDAVLAEVYAAVEKVKRDRAVPMQTSWRAHWQHVGESQALDQVLGVVLEMMQR
jgi:hypothetical protein